MFEHLSYILCFGTLITFIIYMYVRIKYGFWAVQPVFHMYDYGYMLKPPGIISDSLPDMNKYTNLKDIETILMKDLTSIQQQRFANLIKVHYLRNKDNIFIPSDQNIYPYFVGHNDKSFVSFYYKNEFLLDMKRGSTITDRQIIGAITSRPLHVIINSCVQKMDVYYVDYLCVDKMHRKNGIAAQLIQTHHYNQRRMNKNIVVSLFKREDELTGIVPLCAYTTYGFSVLTWTKPFDLSSEYKLLEINAQNYRFLHDFIHINRDKFDIIISVNATNIMELIKTKNIFIYAVLCDEQIRCCYFFRKSCVEVERGMEVLSCFASICNWEEDIFIQGFKISFWKIAAENNFGYAAIENVSHNNIIIHNIMLKTKPEILSPTAYYFYNFAYPSFKAEKSLILL